jgi:hypothetical protein
LIVLNKLFKGYFLGDTLLQHLRILLLDSSNAKFIQDFIGLFTSLLPVQGETLLAYRTRAENAALSLSNMDLPFGYPPSTLGLTETSDGRMTIFTVDAINNWIALFLASIYVGDSPSTGANTFDKQIVRSLDSLTTSESVEKVANDQSIKFGTTFLDEMTSALTSSLPKDQGISKSKWNSLDHESIFPNRVHLDSFDAGNKRKPSSAALVAALCDDKTKPERKGNNPSSAPAAHGKNKRDADTRTGYIFGCKKLMELQKSKRLSITQGPMELLNSILLLLPNHLHIFAKGKDGKLEIPLFLVHDLHTQSNQYSAWPSPSRWVDKTEVEADPQLCGLLYLIRELVGVGRDACRPKPFKEWIKAAESAVPGVTKLIQDINNITSGDALSAIARRCTTNYDTRLSLKLVLEMRASPSSKGAASN